MLTRKLLPLLVPEGLLLLLAVAAVHWSAGIPSAQPVLRLYPAVVLATGLALSWRFHRGRMLLALLSLTLADRALLWLPAADAGAPFAGPVTVRSVAMLLPVTLAVLAFVRERSLLSEVGQRRLFVLGGQAGAVVLLSFASVAYPEDTTRLFDLALLPAPILGWSPVGQPAALVAGLAVAALVGRVIWRPDAECRGFLWAAVGGILATAAGPEEGRSTLYFASAGLVLVASTVESAYAMAYRDELTGLPARRALQEALLRAGDVYTVAMVDVDHFKQFNDTHGHDVGDQVLRMVASRLAAVTGGGKAFRYGGEEFTVLFPGKLAEESAPHLEALREAVAGAEFRLRGKDRPKTKPKTPRRGRGDARTVRVTVSIGAAAARGYGLPADSIVKKADQALYRAKEAGRNRVQIA